MLVYEYLDYNEAKNIIDNINFSELPYPIQSTDLDGNLVDSWTNYAIYPEPINFNDKWYIIKNNISDKYIIDREYLDINIDYLNFIYF
jgi:hypothetical protein